MVLSLSFFNVMCQKVVLPLLMIGLALLTLSRPARHCAGCSRKPGWQVDGPVWTFAGRIWLSRVALTLDRFIA
jgi:hypothetical protein